MAEWSNAADSKSVVREIEPGVQIPFPSPFLTNLLGAKYVF